MSNSALLSNPIVLIAIAIIVLPIIIKIVQIILAAGDFIQFVIRALPFLALVVAAVVVYLMLTGRIG